MPWDAPASTAGDFAPTSDAQAEAAQEPYYEQVPYEELGGFSEDDYAGSQEPVGLSATAEPAPQPDPAPHQPDPAPRQPAASAPQVAAFGEKSPDPEPQPQQPQGDAEASGNEPSFPQMPEDLPPDLVNLLENAFEVFGSDVRVSTES